VAALLLLVAVSGVAALGSRSLVRPSSLIDAFS